MCLRKIFGLTPLRPGGSGPDMRKENTVSLLNNHNAMIREEWA